MKKVKREIVDKLRELYPEDTRIELEVMTGENRMYSGLKGTVKFVDDAGQIHMRWDNGSSLALNVEEDVFRIVHENEIEPYENKETEDEMEL